MLCWWKAFLSLFPPLAGPEPSICSPARWAEIQHVSTVGLLLHQGQVCLGDAGWFQKHYLSTCLPCQVGRRCCCSLNNMSSSWIEQGMAWEHFEGLFAFPFTCFGVGILLWGTFPQMKGPACRSALPWSQQFSSEFTSLGQKSAAEEAGTRAGGPFLGFFSGTGHVCAKGWASECCQPYWAVLAFLTKQDTFLLQQLGSEMMLIKFPIHWYLLRVMGSCWKGRMRKNWPRMVKPHKKTDFPCCWTTETALCKQANTCKHPFVVSAGMQRQIVWKGQSEWVNRWSIHYLTASCWGT